MTGEKRISIKPEDLDPSWVKAPSLLETDFSDESEQKGGILSRMGSSVKELVASEYPQFFPPEPDDTLRPDGTKKGKGFLGPLPAAGGKTSTEISIGVNFDGKETEIPTLVPTLDKKQIAHLLEGGKPTPGIIKKAVEHARMRMASGKPVFATDEESGTDMPTFGATGKNEKWMADQNDLTKGAAEAGLPAMAPSKDESASRLRLKDAIARTEAAGFATPHFIGKENEPTGDRGVTMDIESLVESLKKQEKAALKTGDQAAINRISKERKYWQQEAKSGMSAAEWKAQTGENDPQRPVTNEQGIGAQAGKAISKGLSEWLTGKKEEPAAPTTAPIEEKRISIRPEDVDETYIKPTEPDAASIEDEKKYITTPEGKKFLTEEAWRKEQEDKNIIDDAKALGGGILGLIPTAIKGGVALTEMSGPGAIVSDKQRKILRTILPKTLKGALAKIGYDVSKDAASPLMLPGTTLEAGAQLGDLANKIISGTGNIASRVYHNPLWLGSEEGKEMNLHNRYLNYLANTDEAERRAEGQSIVFDAAQKFGLSDEKRDLLEKHLVDQDAATMLGMVVQPEFIFTKFGKVIQGAMKAGKVERVAEVINDLSKTAKKIPPIISEVPKLPPPLPVATAAKELVEAAPAAEAGGALAQVEKKLPPPLPEAAPRTPPPLPVEPPPLTPPPLPVAAAGEELAKTETFGAKAKAFSKQALQSPSTATLVTAANAIDNTGKLARRMIDFAVDNPRTATYLLGTTASLASGHSLSDSLTYGGLGGLLGGKIFRGFGFDLEKAIVNAEKATGQFTSASNALKAEAEAMKLGQSPTRALSAMAKRLPEGSTEQKMFQEAALGRKALSAIGEKPTLGQTIAAKALRGGLFLGPEIIDPAIRGGLIGGGLQYLASGGETESAIQGFGQGGVLGVAGHQTGKMLMGPDPVADTRYVAFKLSEKTPEVRAKLMEQVASGKKTMNEMANMMQIDDMIKTKDGNIEYLSAPEFVAEIKKLKPEFDETKVGTPHGFFVQAGKDGKPRVIVNIDSAESAALPHEVFHMFEDMGRFKEFTKKGTPKGEDLLDAPRQTFWDELVGEEGAKPGDTKKPGVYSEDDIKRFAEQYYDLLGVKLPTDAAGLPIVGPLEHSKMLSELWADGGGQFMERATKFSGNEGVVEYAKRIANLDEGSIRKLLEGEGASSNGEPRKLGESALFKDKNGAPIKNTPAMEKAFAEFVLRQEGTSGYSGPGEGRIRETVVNESELVDKVDKIVKAKKESSYQGDVAGMDAANKALMDLTKTGLYKTRPKPPAEVTAEAVERAKRVTGKKTVTPEDIESSKPFIPEEEVLNDRNLPFKPGDRPGFMKQSDRAKRDADLVKNLFEAMKDVGAPNEGQGMVRYSTKDGKERYVGAFLSDEQMDAIKNIDPKTLPKGLRSMLEVINDSLRRNSGQVFGGVYFKGIENKGNIRKGYRVFTPTSLQFTKEGNIAATVFDVGSFDKTLRDLAAKNPNSKLLEPFKEAGDTTIDQATRRFEEAVGKYNRNHAENKPGHTDLDPDLQRAIDKKDAINGLFGISGKEVNPLATENNFYKTFRLDRLYELEGVNKDPFRIVYGPEGVRYQELNFLPAEKAPAAAPAAEPFYSQLEETIKAIPQEKMTVGQLRGALTKGAVKADELKWTGFDDVLKRGDESKISKAEALKIAQENAVQVEEVTKGNDADALFRENKAEAVDAGFTPEEFGLAYGKFTNTPAEQRPAFVEQLGDLGPIVEKAWEGQRGGESGGTTKFSQYQLPGGENYKELLFKLPSTESSAFRSTHFDEPNILAHVRFNERTDTGGHKVLFLEEVQSDWHQKGRKEGYAPKGEEPLDKVAQMQAMMRGEIDTLPEAKNTVPDAPFSKNWHELVMKRMLRYAAENGFDKVAWTTGEQQAGRYDLSKQVDSIRANKNPDGTFEILMKKKGNKAFDPAEGDIPSDKLADTVGKDLADKILAQDSDTKDYSGVDLRVGGEGMKGFYDKILPSFMEKYGKKWGAKVGETEISVTGKEPQGYNYEEAQDSGIDHPDFSKTTEIEKVHSVDITPAMKKSVVETGQPMFMPGVKGTFTLTKQDGSTTTFTTDKGVVQHLAKDLVKRTGVNYDDAERTVRKFLGAGVWSVQRAETPDQNQ